MKKEVNVSAKELQDYLLAKMYREWSLPECAFALDLAVNRLGEYATRKRILKEALNFLYA